MEAFFVVANFIQPRSFSPSSVIVGPFVQYFDINGNWSCAP